MAESEIVERVAKAMYPWAWEKANHRDARRTAMVRARTAIEAMRVPTKAMILAGVHHDNMGDMEGRWMAMIDAALQDNPYAPKT